jgi:hypothetical protein
MKPNADFTKRAVVHAATLDWQISPMARVEPDYRHRRLLRTGRERPRRRGAEQRDEPGHFN